MPSARVLSAAAFLLLAGCAAPSPTPTVTTDQDPELGEPEHDVRVRADVSAYQFRARETVWLNFTISNDGQEVEYVAETPGCTTDGDPLLRLHVTDEHGNDVPSFATPSPCTAAAEVPHPFPQGARLRTNVTWDGTRSSEGGRSPVAPGAYIVHAAFTFLHREEGDAFHRHVLWWNTTLEVVAP